MEQSTNQTSKNDRQHKQQPNAKQTWHRPTIVFVPLQTTASLGGSGTDLATETTFG